MRFHRPLLYAGVFLVAIGGIGLAADSGAIDTALLTGIVRLWPLAIIAIGLALVLRRTPLGLVGGLAAAAMPGVLLGSTFAVLPRISDHCGSTDVPANVATQQGTFTAPGLVSVETGCGALTLRTAPGNAWQVEAGNTAGRSPAVVAGSDSLSVAPGDNAWDLLSGGRNDWTVTLPSTLGSLRVDVNTGRATIDLAGARIEGAVVEANMADIALDLSATDIGELATLVNFGHASVLLPAGSDMAVRLEADAGNIEVCAPPDAGLHVVSRGSPRAFTFEGVRQSGGEWLSPSYDTAPYRFEIHTSVSVGSIDINPVGGCR